MTAGMKENLGFICANFSDLSLATSAAAGSFCQTVYYQALTSLDFLSPLEIPSVLADPTRQILKECGSANSLGRRSWHHS